MWEKGKKDDAWAAVPLMTVAPETFWFGTGPHSAQSPPGGGAGERIGPTLSHERPLRLKMAEFGVLKPPSALGRIAAQYGESDHEDESVSPDPNAPLQLQHSSAASPLIR